MKILGELIYSISPTAFLSFQWKAEYLKVARLNGLIMEYWKIVQFMY